MANFSEQRQFPRTPLNMQASIYVLGDKYSCEITDFSLGGLRLKIEDDVFVLDEIVSVSVFMQNNLYKMDLKIKFVSPEFIGVTFFDLQNPIISQLDLLARQQGLSKVTQESKPASKKSVEQDKSTHKELRLLSETRLTGLIDKFLQRLILRLNKKSAQSSASLARRLTEYATILESKKTDLSQDFKDQAMLPVNTFLLKPWVNDFELPASANPSGTENAEISLDDISFETTSTQRVNPDDIENWLTVRVMINEIESKHRDALTELQLRLSTLVKREIPFKDNPFGPFILCISYKEALNKNQIPKGLQKIALDEFKSLLQKELQNYINALNAYLNESGIFPAQPLEEKTFPPSSALLAPIPDVEPGEQEKVSVKAVFNALMERIKEKSENPETQLPGNEALLTGDTPVSNMQLIQAIKALQNTDPALVETSLAEIIIKSFPHISLKLGAEQFSCACIIENIFNSIALDSFIELKIREQMKSLEVPFLKYFLENQSFLNNEYAIERQIINIIAYLGAHGIQRTPDTDKIIANTVLNLSVNFETDNDILANTLLELGGAAEKYEDRKSRNLSKLKELLDGRKKLEDARREVGKVLEFRASEKPIPKAALTLIDSGWKDFLVNTLIRQGNNSQEWNSLLKILDVLISLADDSKKQNTDPKHLMTMIKSGLNSIHAGQTNETLLKELSELFTPNSSIELVTLDKGYFFQPEHEKFRDVPAEISTWFDKIRNFEEGQCLLVHSENKQYIYFFWADHEKDQYIFIDNLGLKAKDLDILELANFLDTNHYEIIDDFDTPASDRAIRSLAELI